MRSVALPRARHRAQGHQARKRAHQSSPRQPRGECATSDGRESAGNASGASIRRRVRARPTWPHRLRSFVRPVSQVVEAVKLCDFGLCAIAPPVAEEGDTLDTRVERSVSKLSLSPTPSSHAAGPRDTSPSTVLETGAGAARPVERKWMLSDFSGSPGFVAPEVRRRPGAVAGWAREPSPSPGHVVYQRRSLLSLTRVSPAPSPCAPNRPARL